MQMQIVEHRFSPRSTIALNADLYYKRDYLGSFKTRDVGYRGLFVETGRIGLLCGSSVQVTLTAPGTSAHHTLDAIVVHYTAEGAGVVFAAHQPEPLSFVRGLLSSIA